MVIFSIPHLFFSMVDSGLLFASLTFWDFAFAGWISPVFYLASFISASNVVMLRPLVGRIVAARYEARKVVRGIVGERKTLPRIPYNFELMCWRWIRDLLSLALDGGGSENYYDICYATEEELRFTPVRTA
ncbi:hypothetical protein HDU93_005188 [Gonapodya sp. JEL0774]|nr:hypothetical protein HDU93_005188 [Gonapodya sp. JEL0774]